MRGGTYCKLCEFYLSYPAELSEKGGVLFGYEPSWLAHMASLDAARLLELQPNDIQTYYLAGDSSLLCERYIEAKQHYLKGLSMNPEDEYLMQQMVKIQREFQQQDRPSPSTLQQTTLNQVENDTDVECSVCYRLLYEPVTTPCGHTFCRTCLARSLGLSSKCPMCRTVLHMGQELPVTIVLHNLIKKVLPAEFEARRQEEEGQTISRGGILPVFVMDILFPGESIALNIFEPRYRLMIRRCLEGNQKFAMAISRSGSLEEIATEVQIRECQPLADGRFYLEVVGVSRIQIIENWEQDGYRVARFRYYSDVKQDEDSFQLDQSLDTLLQELNSKVDKASQSLSRMNNDQFRTLQFHAGKTPGLANVEAFTFWLAVLIRLTNQDRMEVLKMQSAKQRAQFINNKLQGTTCRNM
eukprot:TRINITY_DN5527_c0_g2_i3.p1 TRINITY_DN5527_c0_g2~~TRINITY_DN5527_c0_g2_i3.p1  ORF type:complete len:479 (+),score=43.31 TRINITY_DN5527_c0_g2_i3:204-1439(+)